MQHSLFDRIYLAFLAIMIISFVFLIFFISFFTRRSLIDEKQTTITNEATLIASQAVSSYASGDISAKRLADYFDYYSQTLKADIWYIDESGKIIATSGYFNPDSQELATDTKTTVAIMKRLPSSIYNLSMDYRVNKNFYEISDFHGIYSSKVLSVNVPLSFTQYTEDGHVANVIPSGALLIHTETVDINDTLNNIYSISFIPCLIIIIIAFAFLQIISHKVIRPIRRLAETAEEYSRGDFDAETGIDSKDEIGQLAESMEFMADELSKLEEYRHEFISNISHDFRSPLTSIRGYVTAMLDGTIPVERQDRYLNIVLDETNRLTKLTQGLLDLNRLEIYGPYLKLEVFDFIDVIKVTLNTFEIKCIDKNVAIYLKNHAEITEVNADKTKIQQVVYNLIDNALKFTPEGKKILITIIEKDEKLLVSIKDEGIGMSEDTQRKIWTRFYKDDSSRGKDKAGTGLGLSITKEIIKAHNETITVTSAEGEGSEFIFTLTKATNTATHSGETQILVDPNHKL